MKWTGRAVLGGVARDGKVYVLHWGDDPDAQRAGRRMRGGCIIRGIRLGSER